MEAPAATVSVSELKLEHIDALPAFFRSARVPDYLIPSLVRIASGIYYERRRVALGLKPRPEEYWQNDRNPAFGTPAESAQHRTLAMEERARLKALLGYDFNLSENHRTHWEWLPPAKAEAMKKIFSDYRDIEEQILIENPNRAAPDLPAKSELLAQEKRADIERLLNAEELYEYDLRHGPAANALRGRFGAFQATEAEFRTLYPIYKAAVDSGRQIAVPNPDRREGLLDHEIRKALGEERFTQLMETNDWVLHQTRDVAKKFGLPPATAAELVDLRRDFQARLTAVQRDRSLTQNQRDAQRSAIGAQARERLLPVLGADGLEAYVQTGVGGWLRTLPPPPKKAP